MFLVIYSGNGLVIKREPNLRLFNILFWVSLSFVSVIRWPYLVPVWEDYDLLWIIIFSVGFDVIASQLLERKKNNYIFGQCLNRTSLAAFRGKRRHNILTGGETRAYLHQIQFVVISEVVFQTIRVDSFALKFVKVFVMFYWAFVFALYVPMKHIGIARESFPEMFLKKEPSPIEEFYVRKPGTLNPRSAYSNFHAEQHILFNKKIVRKNKKRKKLILNPTIVIKPLHTIIEVKSVNKEENDFEILENTLVVTAEVHGERNTDDYNFRPIR